MRPAWRIKLAIAVRAGGGRVARRPGTAAAAGILAALASGAAWADPSSPATRPVGIGPIDARPAAASPATTQPSDRLWASHVLPVLNKSCGECHGAKKQKGGLDLRDTQAVFAGGTDGSVVIPGRPGESPLYQRLLPGAQDHMPPGKGAQLPDEELAVIREWIAMLPNPADRPAVTGTTRDWNPAGPTLMELATKVQWQPPAGVEGSAAIDYLIEGRWKEQKVTGADVCDDRAFVRRVYLDLAGRVPSPAEVQAFAASDDPQRRAALVDRLLAGDDYARHLAEVWDVALMERKGRDAEAGRRSHGWFDYLRSAAAANRPWNEVVGDLITARPKSPGQNGAAWFLYEKRNNHSAMAEAVAPVAFGVSVACAQCHNHPLAHEIKQQHYWGLVAAFNRSANVAEGRGGPALSESAVGGFVNFTNLKKESQPAVLALLTGATIAEDRPADGAKETDDDVKYVVPPSKEKEAERPAGKGGGGRGGQDRGGPRTAAVPKFSRRRALADAVTRDNPLLARAFVNRTWAMLLGRGFVNPVDQMDSQHPPSHPELLAWLSGEFERSGYDVKRLIRTIVLSRTYQLDSRWPGGGTPPLPELFARGLEKPLSAEVLHRSLLAAAGPEGAVDDSPGRDSQGRDGKASADGKAAAADSEALRQALIAAFPAMFEVEYNATLQQAMFLTNSPLFDALLRPADRNLTARLLELPTSEARVRSAFAEVLGRQPDDTERAAAVAYLDARKDRPEVGVRHLAWSLLTGAEFLMNH